jgi:putative ABC transport system ATP-binding protein
LIFPFLGDAVGEKLARIRNRHFGFIFQFYHLLPELNVLENTMIASWMCTDGPGLADRKDRARSLLEQVGLSHRLNHRPSQLSGGERQRVAIARALVNDPDVLFADEPTGNLDSETGAQIMGVLESLHARGQTIVMVTHDRSIARRADRSMVMKDGRLQQV